jgi:hypothetical protein
MDTQTAEAVLTTLGNLIGFTGIVLLTVWVLRRPPGDRTAGIGRAAWALWWLWALTLSLYVASEFWLAEEPPHNPPTWLDATNGILENLQSEVIQIWIAALVFKYLRWPGSPESK